MEKARKTSALRSALREMTEKTRENLLLEPRLELEGNRRAVLQGAKGILLFEEDALRVQLNGQVVEFFGRALSIDCLSSDTVEIKGVITRVEFQ